MDSLLQSDGVVDLALDPVKDVLVRVLQLVRKCLVLSLPRLAHKKLILILLENLFLFIRSLRRRVGIILDETFEKLVAFIFISRDALNKVSLILILAVFDLYHSKHLLLQKLVVAY